MMIVFISNFLNHHQLPVASQLFRLTGGEYRFIETEAMPDEFKNNGYSEYNNLPWLIRTWQSYDENEIKHLIIDADVVVFGGNVYGRMLRKRLKQGKLTFEFGERWLKRGYVNLLSPRLIKSQLKYHFLFNKKNLYRLNASAYAANDMRLMMSYKNKMFKWGYFTEVSDIEDDYSKIKKSDIPNIIFVARLIKLKHPEMPVIAAKRLKDKGYDFKINMFGDGPMKDQIQRLIHELDVSDRVELCGTLANADLLSQMKRHQIALMTSDQHEGWAAVVNEFMSCKCSVIASDAIGSAPFLIDNRENGLIFRSGDIDDLVKKIEFLLSNSDICREMGEKAYKTIKEVWSPERAASNFMQLTTAISKGVLDAIPYGPCSIATPI